jgi:hypothetical protein
MTELPFEVDFVLEDWRAEDASSRADPIEVALKLRHERIDLAFGDGRSLWIEQQAGTIRVHGYLSEATGHDIPVNLDIEEARFTVSIDDAGAKSRSDLPLLVVRSDSAPKAAPYNIRTFLDLSTGHLREDTTKRLSRDPGTFESETGYLVRVPGDYFDADRYPDELLTILKAAKSVADYVMFDRDVPTDDRFPVFDW